MKTKTDTKLAGERTQAYWQKTDWNKYRLVKGTFIQDFDSYEALYEFCQYHNIEAQLV